MRKGIAIFASVPDQMPKDMEHFSAPEAEVVWTDQ